MLISSSNVETMFENQSIYIGYFPGSGGNRLRRLILNEMWKTCAGQKLHDYSGSMFEYTTDNRVPKCPPLDTDRTLSLTDLNQYKILISHCMHSPTIKQLFPGRKIIKIYSNFEESLRRWWTVFGKIQLEKINSNLENTIRFHLEYYDQFFDYEADESHWILPNHSDFADFMLKEFKIAQNHPDSLEFDRCWNKLKLQKKWRTIMSSPKLTNQIFVKTKQKT